MGVQPAFAVETGSSVNTIEKKEDCECEIVDNSNQDNVIQLLNEVKVFVNNVLLKFGHMPYVKEKCQDLLDVLNLFNPFYGPLLICTILFIELLVVAKLMLAIHNFFFFINEVFPNIDIYPHELINELARIGQDIADLGRELGCTFGRMSDRTLLYLTTIRNC
jgi:hypothetical protein